MVLLTEVETRTIPKPALGEWRHRITGIKYLNGASQTGPPAKRLPWTMACSRIVQTIETRDGTSQSPCHQVTQMWRTDCQISNENDKYMTSKQYETYEELERRLDLDTKARIIQRNYRAYRLFKFIKTCAQEYRNILKECDKHDEEVKIMYRKRHEDEILRKIYPASRTDLDMLYELIEKWRRDRFQQIKVHFFRSARGSENYSVLQKTVEMMNVIESKIRTIRDDYRSKKRVRFLTVNCEPIRWNGYKGKRVEMVTLKTQKARELKSIYDSIRNSSISREGRIEALIMLKKLVETHSCVEAVELIRLLNQEILLRARDIQKLSFDFLRERIIYGFLRFLRMAAYCGCQSNNIDERTGPEIEKLQEPLEPKTKFCKSCLKLLPYNRFTVHGRMKKLTSCNGCTWLRQRSFAHINYSPYTFLLNCIRADEKRRNCFSALAFVMQEEDIYHLVNNIWHGRSIVSANDDVFLLRSIRYDVNIDWAPWNCIVLTEEEAKVHCRIKDVASIYSKHVLQQIFLANQVAKNHFKRLSMLEKSFRESSRFYKIQDRKDYLPSIVVKNYMF